MLSRLSVTSLHRRVREAERDKTSSRTRGAFRFTGGEITNEFLMSLGYLPGAHCDDCPAQSRILKLKPPPAWYRG